MPHLNAIIKWLGDSVLAKHGDINRSIQRIARLGDNRADHSICFFSKSAAHMKLLEETRAAAVLCKLDVLEIVAQELDSPQPDVRPALVAVDNPRLAFIQIANEFFPETQPEKPTNKHGHIHPTAMCHEGATVCTGAYVSANCDIGPETRIEPNTYLAPGVRIGARCVIGPSAVIGGDGFGYERDESGRVHKFPHRSAVAIGDDVNVGAHATIDRGALTDTTIGDGTKIDDGVYVAHNVSIGRHCLIMAHVVLCGSSSVGDRVAISPGAVIREGINIGDDAHIGLGAVAVKNVDAGAIVAGVPARPFPHHPVKIHRPSYKRPSKL